MKTITLENAEFDLLTNLLVDHLEEISEDEFFHSASHDECMNNMEVTKNTIRSMHCATEDDICYTEHEVGLTL
tara:strand:+ start:406 stop:624 length:219 start_codon:yes stop_codon:yes gene_type:complete